MAQTQAQINEQQFLDLLANAEGTASMGENGYNVGFGGGTFGSYQDHPRVVREFTQTDGKKNQTSAAGRYQFLAKTWDDVAGKLGLTDFSPANQDRAALELIRRRGALKDVQNGDFAAAIGKLGDEWASLPSSTAPQPKRTMQEVLGFDPGAGGVPVQRMTQNGQQMVALPETQDEFNMMSQIENSGYSKQLQQRLTGAIASINAARDQLSTANPLFDDLPSLLDDSLLDIIDRA